MTAIYIFIGGGLGSLARFGIGRITPLFYSGNFPLGTFISNVLACFILAILVVFLHSKQLHSSWMHPLLIIGFCGGFSTFSTFSHETVLLLQNGQVLTAIVNVLVSVLTGVGLIYWMYLKSN